MPAITAAQFLELLSKCNLIPAEQTPQSAVDPQETAKQLVEHGLLTRWQASQLLAGRHSFFLGKYKLLDKLGEGGMGTVYNEMKFPVTRLVALKVISDKALKQPGAIKRFHREMQTVAALNHPNVVTAYDADSVGDTHFLVMEFVPGKDLKQYIVEFGRLPLDWACDVVRQAALGLQHAHEQGLVHRDIKPSNLLIVEQDDGMPLVKILDMGLAKFTSEAKHTMLTTTGQVLGTIDYLSPEQAQDTKGVDIRTDIFSLGATLFQCVTGQVPYQGRNPMEKLMARSMKDAPLASTVRQDLPPDVDAAIARMLCRDPDGRYATPGEVATALE